MRRRHRLLLLLAAGSTLVAISPRRDQSEVNLEHLAWIAGSWVGENGGTEMEEVWMAPKGNLLLGMHRDVQPRGATFFEYLRIEKNDRGVFYIASPMGSETTAFKLKSLSRDRVVFENLEHDYPQRIVYEQPAEHELVARIEGEQDGRLRASQWDYVAE